MWLLPVLSWISTAAARIYYRLTVAGETVPRRGPVLLVANHPNALFDPVLVSAAARRPVRFLAKAPLLDDPRVGWLVRGAGSIPVYRRMDDPTAQVQNTDMFRAAHQGLVEGAAIGVFPEGTSHSEPSLVALKTGAARIALGAHTLGQQMFPIQPIGLVLRQKDVFRSEAAVVVGPPIPWEDLALRGAEDHAAVRELTSRVDAALRQVTLNLERWEDRPMVECAEAIWVATWGGHSAQQVRRLEVTTTILTELRRDRDPRQVGLVRDITNHARLLRRLRLAPADLGADPGRQVSPGWALRRLYLAVPPASVLALTGYLLYWVPYRLTGVVAKALATSEDVRSTFKLLGGIVLYTLWTLVLALTVAWWGNLWFGLAALVAVPTTGLAALWLQERWRVALGDIRRFFVLRSRRELIRGLRQRQHELAVELRSLYERWEKTHGEAADAEGD